MDDYNKDECNCGSGLHPHNIYDGYGIFLRKVCDRCEANALSGYRKDIFEAYDCDEPIEPDDY